VLWLSDILLKNSFYSSNIKIICLIAYYVHIKSNLVGENLLTMAWSTVMGCLCHKWHRICSVYRNDKPVLSSINCMPYHRICNKSNTMEPHVEHELPTLPVHLSSHPVLVDFVCVARCSNSCIMFVDHCLFFWPLYCLSFDLRFLKYGV
jgi:hypothetical protein